MITKFQAIQALRPNIPLTQYGEVFTSPEPLPSEAEIQAKILELQAAEPMRLLRIERGRLIQQTDWRATVDYPNPDKQAWLDYRQALRDLPETADPQLDENGQLTNVIWPLSPEEQ